MGFPSHDEFYRWVVENNETFEYYLNILVSSGRGDAVRYVLGPDLSDSRRRCDLPFVCTYDEAAKPGKEFYDFNLYTGSGFAVFEIDGLEFEYGQSGSQGFWDIKINKDLLVEYKSDVDEMNIEALIRQIKNRRKSFDKPDKLGKPFSSGIGGRSVEISSSEFTEVVVSFDSAFEKYRQVLENEDIELVVIPRKVYQGGEQV